MTMWYYMASVWSRPVTASHCNRLSQAARFEVSRDEKGEKERKKKRNPVKLRGHVKAASDRLWEGGMVSVCVVYLYREGCKSTKWWDDSLERIGRMGSFCRTLNLLIPCWMAFLTMAPLTVSLSWSTAFIPYLYGPILDHPWGGKGSQWGSDSRDGVF